MEGLQGASLGQSGRNPLLWTLLSYPVPLHTSQGHYCLGLFRHSHQGWAAVRPHPSPHTCSQSHVPAVLSAHKGPSFSITVSSSWGVCPQIQKLGCNPGG